MGEVHEMFAVKCGTCTCTKAELLGVLRGLAIAWNGGHRKVQLSVDSETVFRVLADAIPPNSPYIHIIRKCRALIPRQEWEVTISHCYREANRATDWLANYGVAMSMDVVMFEAAPVGLQAVLLEDLSGVTRARLVPMDGD